MSKLSITVFLALAAVIAILWSLQSHWKTTKGSVCLMTSKGKPFFMDSISDHEWNYFHEVTCAEDKNKVERMMGLLSKTGEMSKEETFSILMFPLQSVCKRRIKIGGRIFPSKTKIIYDGHKMICLDDFPGENCLIYSFGIGDDVTFEKAMAHFGCKVFGYDHTIGTKESQGIEDINFSITNKGIGVDVDMDKKLTTLQHELKKHGHESQEIAVLKLDVEGAEIEVLLDWFSTGILERVQQIVIEFHHISNEDAKNVLKGFSDSGFLLSGFDPNWYGSMSNDKPDLFELHFMKKRLNC